MKNITARHRNKGEMVMRQMSEAAQKLYRDSEPLVVAEMDDGTISIRGMFGDIDDLTAAEVEQMFEELQKQIETEDK